MQFKRKETKLIKFVKRALNILHRARIPLRFSQFSNHIYSNHIHLVLHLLRVQCQMSYERFFDWIENFTGLWQTLELTRIPHFTTLQKFVGRCPKRYLDAFIVVSGILDTGPGRITAIDSTGFSLTNASYHYSVVIKTRVYEQYGKRKRGRPRTRRPVRRYLKVTFIVDTDTQSIYVVTVRRGPDSDSKDFIPSYRKIMNIPDLDVSEILADKGYDAEANHRFAHDEMGAKSIIPARRNRSPEYKTKGKFRKKMRKDFDLERYRQRNIVETVNSVIKRKMGGCVRARNVMNQNREVMFMAIAYNVERGMIVSFFIAIGFLGSRTVTARISFPRTERS